MTIELETTADPSWPRVLFATGRLAEPALREALRRIGPVARIRPEVAVLPISVAALMTARWVARHLEPPEGTSRVILPGHCAGDLAPLAERWGLPVDRGPEDLRDLGRLWDARGVDRLEGYGGYDIEILAEVNHAPRLSMAGFLAEATRLRDQGADRIDVGCDPDGGWLGVRECVAEWVARGGRASVDSFDPAEVEAAIDGGADLVLSVNATNRAASADWGVEVVVVPDVAGTLDGLDASVEFLEARGIPYRLDPILEPIGLGFARSLARYAEVRRRWPGAATLMGIGNITELLDADSAGVNALLVGFCQELGISSVLTTSVVNWAQTSVREVDVARRLAYHAVRRQMPPKRVDPRLVMLRDPRVESFEAEQLAEVARRVKDPNWRIYLASGQIHAFNNARYVAGVDPFLLFAEMGVDDPAHAFYLGHELTKARTALTLGKAYRQDRPLDWGFLTEAEGYHRLPRSRVGGSRRADLPDSSPTPTEPERP